jgi:hypothetical protein
VTHVPLPLSDWYMTVDELVRYSRISRRQLERYLGRAAAPLPHVRNGRRVLVLKSVFDEWIAAESPAARSRPARSVDRIIAEVKARHGADSP